MFRLADLKSLKTLGTVKIKQDIRRTISPDIGQKTKNKRFFQPII